MTPKELSSSSYTLKKRRLKSTLPMCPTCSKCKNKSICNNRKNLNKCPKCKKCNDKNNCDKFYFTDQTKIVLLLGYDSNTNKPIKKTITASTKEEAYKKLIEFKEYIKVNGIPLGINKTEKSIIAIGTELENYKFNKGKIGGNTFSTNKATLKRIGNYEFSKIPIEKVTRKQIESFLEDERSKSNSLIKKNYSMLNRIYDYALDRKYITYNFFSGYNKIERPFSKKPDKVVEALTFSEQKIFENYLKENDSKYKTIFLVLLHTGIRVGECLALNINDINFEIDKIKIDKILTKEKNGKVVIHNSNTSKTKNGTRQVDINVFFKSELLNVVENAKNNKVNKKGLVFFNDKGKLLTVTAINSAFKRICKKLNLNKNVNTHCLRHTFATRCIEAGISLPVLQSLMGHDKIQTTIDTYSNIYNYYQQKEGQKYINYLSK